MGRKVKRKSTARAEVNVVGRKATRTILTTPPPPTLHECIQQSLSSSLPFGCGLSPILVKRKSTARAEVNVVGVLPIGLVWSYDTRSVRVYSTQSLSLPALRLPRPSLPARHKPDAHLSPSRTNRMHISPRRTQTGRTSLPVAYKPGAHLSPSRTNRTHIPPPRARSPYPSAAHVSYHAATAAPSRAGYLVVQ